MKHIDDFFQTQSLLIWHPGAMGAFIMNFLEADKPNYKVKLQLNKLGILETKEWQYSDYFMTYYNFRFEEEHPETFLELDRIKKIIIDAYGQENVDKYNSYLIATLTHRLMYKSNRLITNTLPAEILPFLKDIKTINDLNYYLNQIIDEKYHHYVKLHPFHTIIKDIPWKEKILCYFPPEKNWMQFLLHFYKLSFYYTAKYNKPFYDDNLPFEEMVSRILREDAVQLGKWVHHDFYPIIPKEELIHVNVYDFLFKDDGYKQLVNTMTPEQAEILQKGKDSTLEILDFFNVSHELNLPPDAYLSTSPTFKTFRELVQKHYK